MRGFNRMEEGAEKQKLQDVLSEPSPSHNFQDYVQRENRILALAAVDCFSKIFQSLLKYIPYMRGHGDDGEIRETGHSALVTIPKTFLEKLNWQLGNHLKLSIDKDKLVVIKIKI